MSQSPYHQPLSLHPFCALSIHIYFPEIFLSSSLSLVHKILVVPVARTIKIIIQTGTLESERKAITSKMPEQYTGIVLDKMGYGPLNYLPLCLNL